MSIDADIVSVLTAASVTQVFPAIPETGDPPFVVMRRIGYHQEMLLTGPEGTAKSTFAFESWGKPVAGGGAKASAKAMDAQVKAAIEGSNLTYYPEDVDAEQFEPDTLEFMEPRIYSFWHADS